MPIATLTIDLVAKLASLDASFSKASQIAEKNAKKMEEAFSGVGKAIQTITMGVAGYASLDAFKGLIKSAIDAQDNLKDLSKATGVSISDLSGLGSAADKSGSDLESIAQALSKLSVNMGKDPGKFKEIGVTAREPIEALKQLADVFVGIKDPQERAAVAAEALGKSWQGVAPLLAEGGLAIGEMVDRGKSLSKVTEESAARADELNDKLVELKASGNAVATEFANSIVPWLTKLSNEFLAARSAGLSFYESITGIGLSNPLKSSGEQIVSLSKQIDDLNDKMSGAGMSKKRIQEFGLPDYSNQIAYLEKLRGYYSTLNNMSASGIQDSWLINKPSSDSSSVSEPSLKKFIGGEKKGNTESIKEFTASTKDYQAAMDSLSAAMLRAQSATSGLDDAQETLHKVMSSPEWETYSQAMQWSVIEQASFASGALSAADAQKHLNDLLADTPTAQLEKVRKDAELLEQALAKAGSADEYKKIKEALDGVYESANKGADAMDDMKKSGTDSFRELQQAVEGWGRSSADAFVEWAATGKLQFSDLVSSMLKDLAKMIVYQNVMKPLFSTISDSISGSGLSNMLGFGGGRAGGGSVTPGNYYVVGENGPEVLVPNASGTVIPNNRLMSSQGSRSTSGAGMSVSITQHISVDARSDRSSIIAAMSQAKESAKAEILASMQRGGVFAKA